MLFRSKCADDIWWVNVNHVGNTLGIKKLLGWYFKHWWLASCLHLDGPKYRITPKLGAAQDRYKWIQFWSFLHGGQMGGQVEAMEWREFGADTEAK